MSSRHHIDNFMRGPNYWKDRRRAKNNRCCQGVRHPLPQRCFTAVEVILILHGMCSRRHGGGRVRSTMPAEDRYIVQSAKGTGARQLSGWQMRFLLPQESRSPEKLLPDV
ncbi:hypothetical protein TNCV_1797451 [Trichonephila clavipes]|nr:hypothetical protein TNCV_1797451 [Trichonephila clavipes]